MLITLKTFNKMDNGERQINLNKRLKYLQLLLNKQMFYFYITQLKIKYNKNYISPSHLGKENFYGYRWTLILDNDIIIHRTFAKKYILSKKLYRYKNLILYLYKKLFIVFIIFIII